MTQEREKDRNEAGESQEQRKQSHVERGSEDPAPFELEEPEPRQHAERAQSAERASSPAEQPETCPNCMAPMHERGALVCLRCGFDLKTLRVARTVVRKTDEDDEVEGEEEVEEADEEARGMPLCRPGLGGVQLPLAMAAASGLLLLIGILAGWPGLFPPDVVRAAGDDPISWLDRFANVGRLIVLIAAWSGCAVGGVWLLAITLERPLGDLTLTAARMLGIIAAIRLAMFIHLPGPAWVEWMLEAVLQLGLFVGLTLALFRLHPRDGLMLGGWTLMLILVLLILAHAVVWAH